MKLSHTVGIFVVAGAAAACASADLPTMRRADLAIENVHIVDLETGDPGPVATIIVDAGQIVSIEPNRRWLRVGTRVDGRGAYITPGLWDMHAHFGSWPPEDALPRLLDHGVLGVREMGWGPEAIELRDQVARGEIEGPVIVAAGYMLDGPTDFPYRRTVTTTDEAREAVALSIADGADFIKVHSNLSHDAYREILRAAQSAGVPVAGHVPDGMRTTEAVAAGQDAIEHLYMYWCDFTEGQERTLANCADQRAVDDSRAVLDAGTAIAPTLAVYYSDPWRITHPAEAAALRASVPAQVAAFWDEQEAMMAPHIPPGEVRLPQSENDFRRAVDMTAMLHAEGARIMAGTDFSFLDTPPPGAGLHDELRHFVNRAGFSPLAALRSATVVPAAFLGMADDWSVTVGAPANFVIFADNPAESVESLSTIRGVVRAGAYRDSALNSD